jgi:hypothetical protein
VAGLALGRWQWKRLACTFCGVQLSQGAVI